jgi:transposase-like protein
MLFYVFDGRIVVRMCRPFGISRQTFYSWKRRFDHYDLTTLEEFSRRPHEVRRRSVPRVGRARSVLAQEVSTLLWGKDKLVVLLRREKRAVSRSTVGRILVDPLC